jgi:hypothetical protein
VLPKNRCQKDRRSLISNSDSPSFGFYLVSLILPGEAQLRSSIKKGYSPKCLEGKFFKVRARQGSLSGIMPPQIRQHSAGKGRRR